MSMTKAEDRADLDRHEREIEAHQSFNYAVLDDAEERLLGCVYLDPPDEDDGAADVLVSWWLVDDLVNSPLDAHLTRFIPQWVVTAWPFRRPSFAP